MPDYRRVCPTCDTRHDGEYAECDGCRYAAANAAEIAAYRALATTPLWWGGGWGRVSYVHERAVERYEARQQQRVAAHEARQGETS